MDVFDNFPLARFSVYTQVQRQILDTESERIAQMLDRSFGPDGQIDGIGLNDAYGRFWLWILGAYEMLRTMDEHPACFSPGFADQVNIHKRRLAKLRMPFAKQQLAGRDKKAIAAEASISSIDTARRDFSFVIGEESYWVRTELGSFHELLIQANTGNVLSDLREPRSPSSAA